MLPIAPTVPAGLVRKAPWQLTLADYRILAFLLAGLCRVSLSLHFWDDDSDAQQHAVAFGIALAFWWCVVAVAMSRAAIDAFVSRLWLHCIVLTHGCFFPGVIHFSRLSAFTGDNWLGHVAWLLCFLISLAMVWLIVEVKHAAD